MYKELDLLDDQLAQLAVTLRGGDVMRACLQLAEFALELDHAMHREERTLEMLEDGPPATATPLGKIRREHGSLRSLVAAIASALDAGDDRRGVELVGKLRSVLLVHLAKEELISSRMFSFR